MIKHCLLFLFTGLFFIQGCADSKNKNESDQSNGSLKVQEDKSNSSFDVETSSDKTYHIRLEPNGSSIMDIYVRPQGFENTSEEFKIMDADPLDKFFIEDLDKDGFDELYLITRSVGSGSYAKIFGWASNRDLSSTPIYIRPLHDNDLKPGAEFYGYMGHDSIYVSNNTLYRNFPIYKEDDEQCCPTGGDKTLEYKLTRGEASWILEIYKPNK